MSQLSNINQKIKGRAQKIKGDFEDKTGQHFKGKMDKIEGQINESAADFKLKVDR